MDGSGGNIDDLNGLAQSRPLMAMAMTVFMLSLTGVPLTAGFVGKFMIFSAAVQAGLFGLAVVGVLDQRRQRVLLHSRRRQHVLARQCRAS